MTAISIWRTRPTRSRKSRVRSPPARARRHRHHPSRRRGQSRTPAPPPAAPAPASLPPNPRMIGRKDRLEELVKAILEEDRPIVIPGALGMGKTTLALAAAHDPRIIARFCKDRRFFVNLEPAPNAEGVLTRLASHLGLPASGAASEVEAKIAAACAAQPTLAILDNLETPWRKDVAATEALLGRLAAIEGLRLVITVRGEPPTSTPRPHTARRRTASRRRRARPVPAPRRRSFRRRPGPAGPPRRARWPPAVDRAARGQREG